MATDDINGGCLCLEVSLGLLRLGMVHMDRVFNSLLDDLAMLDV